MVKERLKSPRARLFVALDLPGEIREGIDAWGSEALRDPALRRVAPESLHVTLAFLGYRAEKEIGRIAEAVGESAGPATVTDPCRRRPSWMRTVLGFPRPSGIVISSER